MLRIRWEAHSPVAAFPVLGVAPRAGQRVAQHELHAPVWLSLAAAAHGPTRPDVVVLHGLPPADAALGRVNLLERSDVTISLVVRPDIEIGGEHASNRKQSHECESNQFQF